MKHVLSPADILFNRYVKTRMPLVLEAAVRVTGDLGMHKETDKAKQTAQSALQPQELAVLRESAIVLGAVRSRDPCGRDCPGRSTRATRPEMGWHAFPCLEKTALKAHVGPSSLLSCCNQQRRAGASGASLSISSSRHWRGRSLFGGPDVSPLSVERIVSFISDFEI